MVMGEGDDVFGYEPGSKVVAFLDLKLAST